MKWYRATCFGEPCGLWRDTRREVYRDLEAQKLGSYDEWMTFYVTVPGGIEVAAEWMDYDVWEAERSRFNPAFARPARLHGLR